MINKMYIFKFKYCYKSKHYALILSQEHSKYKYLTLTHKSKVNNKNCIRLCHNPNLNSKRLSYLVPRTKNSPIKNFSKKFLKNFILSEFDKCEIENYIKHKSNDKFLKNWLKRKSYCNLKN